MDILEKLRVYGKNRMVDRDHFGHNAGMKNRIAEWRKIRNLSMAKLGALVGTSDTQINKLEKGERRLSDEWLYKIATALNVRPSDLLSAEHESPQEIAEGLFSLLDEQQAGFVIQLVKEMLARKKSF